MVTILARGRLLAPRPARVISGAREAPDSA
jgi:hypothetical protein